MKEEGLIFMTGSIGRAIVISVLLLTAGACRPLQPSPEQGSGGVAMPRDMKERYIHQVIYSMRDSFVSRDVPGFMKHVSDGFYRGHARLQVNLQETFSFGPPVLAVEIESVEFDEQKVTAVVKWNRSAKGGEESPPREREGESVEGKSVLIFHQTDRVSLVDFREDPLFGIPGF